MEKWEIVSHIVGISGFILSFITAIALLVNERKNLEIRIYDVMRKGDRNYLLFSIVNKSRLNISVLAVHIIQDETFELDHNSKYFQSITVKDRVIHESFTVGLPINICGLDSVRGVARTIKGVHTLYSSSAEVVIYTNRGRIEQTITINSDGSLKDVFSF